MIRECSTIYPSFTEWAKATGVLTGDNSGNFTNNKIVTIGSRVYTFKTNLSSAPTVPNEIKIGASADATLGNLVKAINGSGVAGTDYSVGTTANTQVTAGAVAAHATTVTAIEPGFAGNEIATSTDEAKLSWGDTILVGGLGGDLRDAVINGADELYSDPIDVGIFTELTAFLNVVDHGGTSPTLDVDFEYSADGVNWVPAGSNDDFTQVTETDGLQKLPIPSGFGKYVRAHLETAGTTPMYQLTLILIAKG